MKACGRRASIREHDGVLMRTSSGSLAGSRARDLRRARSPSARRSNGALERHHPRRLAVRDLESGARRLRDRLVSLGDIPSRSKTSSDSWSSFADLVIFHLVTPTEASVHSAPNQPISRRAAAKVVRARFFSVGYLAATRQALEAKGVGRFARPAGRFLVLLGDAAVLVVHGARDSDRGSAERTPPAEVRLPEQSSPAADALE